MRSPLPAKVAGAQAPHPTQMGCKVQNCRCRDPKVDVGARRFGYDQPHEALPALGALAFQAPAAIVQAAGNALGFCGFETLRDQHEQEAADAARGIAK